MHAMAKMAKNRQPLSNFELDAKSVPLETGNFDEIARRLVISTECGKGSNWMPKVAP